MSNRTRGYTLVELLTVIIIIGVMAGLAIPNYSRTVEETRANEARVNLQVIRTGEKVYALNNANRDYWNPGTTATVDGAVAVGVNGAGGINQTLNVDITTQFYDITSIIAGNGATPKTLEVLAKRNIAQGGNNTRTYQIDQNGVITQTAP